jgi:DNA (cytosine-5)-methyltransferase 3A
MTINVLSLFDGISCGMIALERAGIEVGRYYASEIDKHATKVSKANYPNITRLGDVEKWREWDIDWASIDLLIGGSPCQGFSFAGKQLAFDDPRSKLFFVYLDILNHLKCLNPKIKSMLENVKMKKEYLDVISERLCCDPVMINSQDHCAVSRPRYYWANFYIDRIKPNSISFLDVVDGDLEENVMSEGWHDWWKKNKQFQVKKSYSAIPSAGEKGVTMTARQYASWNGNYIRTPSGKLRKPTKDELGLLHGIPSGYFDCTSQRQAEIQVGNGWQVDTVAHIFKCMVKNEHKQVAS